MSKKFLNAYRYPRPLPVDILVSDVLRVGLVPSINPRPGSKSTNFNNLGDVLRLLIKSVRDALELLIANLRAALRIPMVLFWRRRIRVEFKPRETLFKISNLEDMKYIWDSGFYGKGVLSRSEPTWFERSTGDDVFSEHITQNRRLNREIWKAHRDKLITLENQLKLQHGELNDEHLKLVALEREKLNAIKEQINKFDPISTPNSSASPDSSTDELDHESLKSIEYLQLAPYEALFLLQIGLVQIDNYTPDKLLVALAESLGYQFLVDYAVYYHYRSLGWCVKPGMKFSADFVLYSRGPPFTHAEFALKIIRDTPNGPIGSDGHLENMVDLSATLRVVSGVKKCLVLAYVENASNGQLEDHLANLKENGDIYQLLNEFYIGEVSLNRWIPSRTRN